MSDTATETAANPDQTQVHAGRLADGRFFGLMHKGDGHPHTVIGLSLAQLHRRLTNAAIAEFRMDQDGATALATDSVNSVHEAMTAPPPPTVEQLEELQQEVLLVTAERDKALADVAKAKGEVDKALAEAGKTQAEVKALEDELKSTKDTVSDLEAKIATMSEHPSAPTIDTSPAGTDGKGETTGG